MCVCVCVCVREGGVEIQIHYRKVCPDVTDDIVYSLILSKVWLID